MVYDFKLISFKPC